MMASIPPPTEFEKRERELMASMEPPEVAPMAPMQVTVHAKRQVAELEIRAGAFDSYEELCSLVVNSLPQLFGDDGADPGSLLVDYKDQFGKWRRAKAYTPIEVAKAGGCFQITRRQERLKKLGRKLRGRENGGAKFTRVACDAGSDH